MLPLNHSTYHLWICTSAFAVAWLERRLYWEIGNALKGILSKDLDLQFVAAS
jgi:hypothetical protein